MENMVFHLLFINRTPVVADGHDVTGRVIVEIIYNTIVAIVMDLVIAPVIFGTKVDVESINGSDTPEVARDDIIADDGLVVFIHAIDADATAAVHGVVFIVIVDELVSFNDGRNGQALLVVAIASIGNNIVFQQYFCGTGTHKVSYRNSAYMP